MSLAGLISGVMGGAAKGYGQYAESELKKQQELDLRKQMLEAETEKQLRIDEIKRTRDFSDRKRDIEELDPLRRESKAADTRVVGQAETEVMASRENALRAGKIQTAKDTALAAGEADRQNLSAFGSDRAAQAGARIKAQVSHVDGVGSVAQANLANFELGQKKAVADLRQELVKTPADDPRRAEIERRIKDLSGATTSKSYGDMVTAAGHYRLMAQNLRQDAEKLNDPAEQSMALQRAMDYEREADAILQSTREKRLGDGGKAAKPTPAKPGSIDLNQFFLKK